MSTACMTVLLLLFPTLAAIRINETSAYLSCMASPSTCGSLTVYNDQATGTVPTELGTLTSLTFLWLSSNRLTGSLPSELGALSRLTRIWSSDNQLTGTIPSMLGRLSTLTRMDIDGNRLTSSLPTELGALTRLTYLWLHHNQLSGAIPSELGAVTSLMYMRVHNNAGLCGDIPVGLSLSAGTSNTRLGSACLSLAPSAATTSPSSTPTTDTPTGSPASSLPESSGDHPLKDNWFRKRSMARKKAFPQRNAWWRKQVKGNQDQEESSQQV
eukprot:CAMPEP_0114251422 /NCGR_PEP_ID=MMETSP0058-20121206/15262_1 /TAXON_ID=36894 /ORGANISM="Pyramimonas parkeae, CCMP726" /LENGTH=269 /DNA_ID=CAMNT_0001365223 /DNA_START=90 /DNA_END=899 /DNA_ORIENTATION=+